MKNMLNLSDRTLIVLLVVLQLAVCLPFISSFPIALDEPFSIFWAQQDVGEMVKLFKSENNPPLHFLILHYWIELFGIGPIAVRSLSLIFSLLTIPVIFQFARKFVSKELALLVALIFISSRFNHYHALEARVYSIFVLLSTLAFYELYQILFENKRSIWLFTLVNVLLLYAHYLGVFVLVVEVLITIVSFRRTDRKLWLLLSLSALLTVLLYLPGIEWFLLRFGDFSNKGTWVPDAQYSELYGNIIRFFNSALSFVSLLLILLALVLLFGKKGKVPQVGLLFSERNRFVFLIFLIPYLGMFIYSKIGQPVFLDRYLLFTTVPLYLLFVVLVDWIIPKEKNVFALILIVPLLFSTKWKPENNREPNAEAAYILTMEDTTSAKAICPPFYDLTFMYHYNRKIFEDYRHFEENKLSLNVSSIYGTTDIKNIDSLNSLFYIDANSDFIYPQNTIKSDFDQLMTLEESREFKGGVVIYYYKRKK